MNKPRNRKANRVSISLRVDASTFEAIEAIRAHETGKSQSEVVDRAMRVYAAALAYVNSQDELQSTELYQRLEELLK